MLAYSRHILVNSSTQAKTTHLLLLIDKQLLE